MNILLVLLVLVLSTAEASQCDPVDIFSGIYKVHYESPTGRGHGTATYVEGHLITNEHVARDSDLEVEVLGVRHSIPTSVSWVDKDLSSLALTQDLQSQLGDSLSLYKGSIYNVELFSLGFGGNPNKDLQYESGYFDYFEDRGVAITARIHLGQSGGPTKVCDNGQWKVIGINWASSWDKVHKYIAGGVIVPAEDIEFFIEMVEDVNESR